MGFKRILDECSFATFSGRACEARPLSGYAENIIEGYLSRVPERLNVVRAEPDNFISRLVGSAECARTEGSARRVGVETKVSVGWLVRSLAHDHPLHPAVSHRDATAVARRLRGRRRPNRTTAIVVARRRSRTEAPRLMPSKRRPVNQGYFRPRGGRRHQPPAEEPSLPKRWPTAPLRSSWPERRSRTEAPRVMPGERLPRQSGLLRPCGATLRPPPRNRRSPKGGVHVQPELVNLVRCSRGDGRCRLRNLIFSSTQALGMTPIAGPPRQRRFALTRNSKKIYADGKLLIPPMVNVVAGLRITTVNVLTDFP